MSHGTQAHVVALFQYRLGYRYPGNWIDRDSSNIDQPLLEFGLKARGVPAQWAGRCAVVGHSPFLRG